MRPSTAARGAGVAVTAALLVMTTSAATTEDLDERPAEPVAYAIPPASTSADIMPVSAPVAPVTDVVAPTLEIVRRTASVDGAVGHDASDDGEVFTLAGDVFFEFDSADLTDRARSELADIAAQLTEAEADVVAVLGHTDGQGSRTYNDELSEARAMTVRDTLADAMSGIEITAEGRGMREPVADETGTAEEVERAQALNRRVTIATGGEE